MVSSSILAPYRKGGGDAGVGDDLISIGLLPFWLVWYFEDNNQTASCPFGCGWL